MSLLERDITRKRRVEKTQLELNIDNSKEYKIETIWDNAVYKRESELSQLPGLYYLVSWKGYFEKKNIWKLSSAVQYLDKLTTTPLTVDMALSMTELTAKPSELAFK